MENATPSLRGSVELSTTSTYIDLELADLDGDEKIEFVAISSEGTELAIGRVNQAMSLEFDLATISTNSSVRTQLEIAKLDGVETLFVTHEYSSQSQSGWLALLRWKPSTGIQVLKQEDVSWRAHHLFVKDLNLDGIPEMIASGNDESDRAVVRVIKFDSPSYSHQIESTHFSSSNFIMKVDAFNADSDGELDLVLFHDNLEHIWHLRSR